MIVHVSPAATVAPVAVTEVPPATGVNVAGVPPPVHAVVALGGVATCIRGVPPSNGNVSVMLTFGRSMTLVFPIAIVRVVAFPPSIRVEFPNALSIVGTGTLSMLTLWFTAPLLATGAPSFPVTAPLAIS